MILEGIHVLDSTSGIAGPLAALRLGDLGATVTKVEAAPGDWTRGAAPQLPGHEDGALFHTLNRGKRSLAVDASDPAQLHAILGKLLGRADVLITDQPAAAVEAFWGSHPSARPELIWIDISAWGARGPRAGRPGSELVAQAAAGYTRYLGHTGAPARRLGTDIAGVATGIFAVQAVLAALFHRGRGGDGQRVSMSLLNSVVSMESVQLAAQSDPDSYQGPRVGGAHYPEEYGWRASDNSLTFSFGGSVGRTGRPGWERFVEDVGLDWMLSDERFDRRGMTTTGNGSRAVEMKPEYEKGFARFTAEEIVDKVREYGGHGAEFFSHEQALNHPQTAALGIIQRGPDAEGAHYATAFPARYSRSSVNVKHGPGPTLGQHNAAVLDELGFSAEAIADHTRRGTLVAPAAH